MKKQTCDFSMLYANAWLNSWNITFWQLKKTKRLKKLFDIPGIPYKFIFKKHCIRKAMLQKKHQLCFVVPKEKGCSVHLFVKKKPDWMTNLLKSESFRGFAPWTRPNRALPWTQWGLTATSDPLGFLRTLHFQPGYAPDFCRGPGFDFQSVQPYILYFPVAVNCMRFIYTF